MLSWICWLIEGTARLAANRRGAVLIYTAIAMPAFVGAVGLAVDVASWHVNRRAAQNIVDAAAVAGALEALRTGSSGVVGAATADAAKNGYEAAGGETLVIEYPPSAGPYAGAGDAVAVRYSRMVPTLFSALFIGGETGIGARAVARAQINDTCVWSLNLSAASTLKFSGGGNAVFDCGMIANSSNESALTQTGGGCVTATSVKVAGGFSGTCINPTPLTNVRPVPDPFAAMPPPDYSGCDHSGNFKANAEQTLTLNPGVYCGKIEAVSNGRIQFQPGLYILDNVGMTFGGQSVITGLGGTTFYLTPNSTNNATINVSAGASVTLHAPSSGAYAGVLFYQDRDSTANLNHSLTGGAGMDLDGVIYFPNQNLNFSGGSATNNSSSILIANTVSFTGQAHLGDFGDSAATTNPGMVMVALVE